MQIYKFSVVTKHLIWGREEWVLSAVDGSESIVTSPSEEKGSTIKQLISRHKARLMGKANYERSGEKFPLLVKFIDANQDLSIQVHPADEYAMEHHQSLGKNEMWYLLEAKPETHFRVGFNTTITPEEYEQRIAESTILDVLNNIPVGRGDIFYLPAGRVHAISGGSSLLEVQQSSDITYRIFDYNRTDSEGKPRALHTQQAKEVLDFEALIESKTAYQMTDNEDVKVIDVPSFTTSLLSLNKPMSIDLAAIDSFVLLACTKGSATLTSASGEQTTIGEREVALIPAEETGVRISPEPETELMKVYIR